MHSNTKVDSFHARSACIDFWFARLQDASETSNFALFSFFFFNKFQFITCNVFTISFYTTPRFHFLHFLTFGKAFVTNAYDSLMLDIRYFISFIIVKHLDLHDMFILSITELYFCNRFIKFIVLLSLQINKELLMPCP